MLKAYLLQSGLMYLFIFSTFLHAMYGLQWKNEQYITMYSILPLQPIHGVQKRGKNKKIHKT